MVKVKQTETNKANENKKVKHKGIKFHMTTTYLGRENDFFIRRINVSCATLHIKRESTHTYLTKIYYRKYQKIPQECLGHT